MAESIIVHFSDATGPEIFAGLASRCEKAADRAIYFYPNNAAYVLLISEYSDYDVEYGPEEKSRLEGLLHRRPRFSLVIELRRSKQEVACEAAEEIVSRLCATHDLVVDDDYHRFWTRSEIRSEGEFLRVYRNEKRG
jgi:hypothetical protein